MGIRQRVRVVALIVVFTATLFSWPEPTYVARAAVVPPDEPAQAAPSAPGTFRAATSGSTSPINAVTVGKPAGTTTNDLLLAAISINEVPTITAPSGWTHIRTETNGTTMRQALYWKVATGSEPSDYTWTFATPVDSAVGAIAAFSGVDTTTPIDVSGGQTNASSTSVAAPSVTTTVADTWLVGAFGTSRQATFTPPSGMTERADVDADGQADVSLELATVAQAVAGASGTKTATASGSAANVGQLVALRPSGTIAFRAAATGETLPITSLTITKPSGTTADDVLVAGITTRGAVTITAPAGWSEVRVDVNGTSLTQALFTKVATGSEPADYTFTHNVPISASVGAMLAYSGLDTTTPVDVSGGQANASSTTITAPSITTTVADTILVGYFGIANDVTMTAPSGMTERTDVLVVAANDVASSSADTSSHTTAGATGTKAATASSSGANIGQLVALRPAGAIDHLGVQSQHTFERWDLGSGDGLAVNVVTRNAVVSHPILDLPIRGSRVAIAATYNAKDPANVGMGPGWRLDVFRRLRTNGDGSVTFTDGTGARHTFTNPQTASGVTTYTRPATLYATLTKDTNQAVEFSLRYKDRSLDRFDISGADGLLVRAEDRHGNGVDFAYTSGNLTTITDTAPTPDRTIDLTWDTGPTPDRLTTITDWVYVSGGVTQSSATGSRRAHRFHYDAGSGRLAGWSNPVDTSGACPTAASHRTCLTYTAGLLTAIAKTQTVTTESSGTLGTTTRTATTEIAYSGSDVSTVTDAHQQAQGSPARTTFTAESTTKVRVDRPTTTTSYGAVAAGDAYARVQSVWRKWDATTAIETRTTWDATYPIEPATVTANYGALLSTPARTTTYTYVASSMGNVAKIVEPLTGTDDRWTEFTYNANDDVTEVVTSLEGSGTDRTVRRTCYVAYATDASCPTTATGLSVLRTIDNYTSGGATDEDTNVEVRYTVDAYGQVTAVQRFNRDAGGSLRDSREDRFTYDDTGNLTTEIVNYDDGTITPGTDDTIPDAVTEARTDLTTVHTYDTAGNRLSTADPRRAIAGGATTHARDAFGRTVADDWGTADTGGSWSGEDATFDVGSGIGTIALSSATNRNAQLSSVSARDLELLVKVRVDRLASGSDPFTRVELRRQDASNFYEARVKFGTTGEVTLLFKRTSGGVDTAIGASGSGLFHATADWYWLRVRLEGTTSTNAKMRLWRDGTSEPGGWTLDATDGSTPAGLQGTGHLGLRFQVPGGWTGATPVTASYDELTVTSIGGGGGAIGADDYVSRSTYDALGQQVTSTTPTTPGVTSAAATTTTVYDEFGLVRHVTDTGGLVSAMVYDRAGRAIAIYEDPGPSDPADTIARTTVDADGRPIFAESRAETDTGSSTDGTVTAYDALGRVETVTEADTTADETVTVTEYDALDRVTATELGDGSASSQRTEFTHDLGGRVTETDDGFACATATYDWRDLATSQTFALAGGSCASAAETRTVDHAYDGLGRLTETEVTAGTDTGDRPTIVTYDAAGNALTSGTEVASTVSTTDRTINLLGQVTADEPPDGSTTKRTYDPVGNALDVCYWRPSISVGACLPVGSAGWTNPPTSSTSSTWDARNGRIGLTDSETNQTTVYDPDELYQPVAVYTPTLADHSRELQTLYTYDERHRLETLTHRLCTISSGHACSATSAAGDVTYAYDANDSRTGVDLDNGSTSADRRYCYDGLDRLAYRNTGTACSSVANDEAWTYDEAGNRLTATTGGTTTNFAYDATGLLCDVETGSAASCTGGNVTSDSAGRISDRDGWHYLYDAQGRLVSACDDADCVGSGFARLDFTYDGEGRRTQIVETPPLGPAITRTFRYQGGAIVQELVDGTVVRDYLTTDAGTIVKVIVSSGADAGTYHVTYDGHGDAMALWRENGDGSLTLANSYTYSTWGKPTTATHNSIGDLGFRFLYVGAYGVQWDEAGLGAELLYMRARHYDPALGRFLQPDPSGQEANLYAYAEGSPASRIDADGTCSLALTWVPYIGPAAAAATCAYAAIVTVGTALRAAANRSIAPGVGVAIGWAITNVTVQDNRRAGLNAEARAFRWIWRPGRFYGFHVWFPTSRGSRYLDICEWNSLWEYGLRRFRPNICWEVKSGDALYWGTEQWRKDMEIMAVFGFPIRVIRSWGVMDWP